MPPVDRRVSEDTEILGVNVAAGDLFDVVDVSDSTDAASGTNKKITAAETAVAITVLGALATTAALSTAITVHNGDTTAVHGISDTADLLRASDAVTLAAALAGDLAANQAALGMGAGAALGATQIIRFVVDGGGSTITTGAKKAYVTVPWAATITSWNILPDQSGSVVFDIWKDTYANYPPTVADTIAASAKPTLTTATKATGSTLTGWTTSIAAGDVLEINVDSVTTCTKVVLELLVTRTT